MSASIVVPVYNALEFAKACIESIYQARTSIPFEVIVVDNGSGREVQEWAVSAAARYDNLRYLRFEEPLGFPRAVNRGALVARHERLVVLNSDAIVYDDWLDLLAAALDDDRIAVAGPVTNQCGNPAQRDLAAQALDAGQARVHAASIHQRSITEEPQSLVFFCAMIRRSAWLELNGLDETYSPGNFEDDDFCLRARMRGYRLAIASNVFVFHHSGKSFEENRVDHGEALARSQLLFCGRAVTWSKLPSVAVARKELRDTAVVVPVPMGRAEGLRDSLASLANQTVTGFEVIVVSPESISPSPAYTIVRREGNLAALLNAGIAAAAGRKVAFLPAGDVYYPFHLEMLSNAASKASYCAWSVNGGGRRGVIRFDQAAPNRLAAGDWAPLVCWMHAAPPAFDESLDELCGWDWVMRLRERPNYIPRVTCEKTARPCSADEARRVADQSPVSGPWLQRERQRFVAGIERGEWERTLIVEGNAVERRARRMLGSPNLHLDFGELEAAKARLSKTSALASSDPRPTVFFFSIISWTELTQRPHHFARGLAARGYRVYWIDVRLKAPELVHAGNLAVEIEPNLFYVELPCAAGELYRLEWHPSALDAMEAAFQALAIQDAIQFVNFPKWTPLALRLRARFGWPIVYDCLDDQQAFGQLHPGNDPEFEAQLIDASALLITSGRTLYARHRLHHPNTILIQNAADFDLFGRAVSKGLLDRLARPIVGFFGAFSDWLDLDWIEESARRFPEWSFVYVGREGFSTREAREQWVRATSAANIHVLGQADPQTLAAYLAQFDVCTMPFRDLPITRSMNAVKIFEYLAAGKPVVAPDLPETRPVADLGLIATYDSPEASFRLLAGAIAGGQREDLARARQTFAVQNTWKHRLEQLVDALSRCRSKFPAL